MELAQVEDSGQYLGIPPNVTFSVTRLMRTPNGDWFLC